MANPSSRLLLSTSLSRHIRRISSSSSSSSSASFEPFEPPPAVTPRRVVVTGLGMVTPLGCGDETTWKRLIEGKCGVRAITPDDLKMDNFDREMRLHTFERLTSKVTATVPSGTEQGEFNEGLWLNSKAVTNTWEIVLLSNAAAYSPISFNAIGIGRSGLTNVCFNCCGSTLIYCWQ